MSDPSKSAVLKGVAVTVHTWPLSLPRHRSVLESKVASARLAMGVVQPLKSAANAVPRDEGISPELQRQRAEDERKAAHEIGLRDGLAEAQQRLDEAMRERLAELEARADAARDKHRAEHEQALKRMSDLIESAEAASVQRIDTLEIDAIELAFEAVCRLMGAGRADRDAVAALITQAVAQLRSGTLLRVRLNPDDLEAIQGSEIQTRHAAVEWVADSKIEAGGCLLDTDAGTLDARLERQLSRLRDIWLSEASRPVADAPPAS